MSTIQVQGRLVSEADLANIRQLREGHPQWSRQQLSVHLAEEWQWRNQAGRLKDMAARTLLLKLQARGLIELPLPLRGGGNHRRKPSAHGPVALGLPKAPPAPIQGALPSLRPLGLELVDSLTQRRRVGYRTSKNGRKYYRQPAYLLTTDQTTPAAVLLQDYLDRWGIEVNHRDEKEILSVGEAQVWNEKSVSKVPALLVAMYSWLQLSGLACYGPTRTVEYEPLPKWRRNAQRPSCLDLVTLLRKQLAQNPTKFVTGSAPPTYPMMVGGAAA